MQEARRRDKHVVRNVACLRWGCASDLFKRVRVWLGRWVLEKHERERHTTHLPHPNDRVRCCVGTAALADSSRRANNNCNCRGIESGAISSSRSAPPSSGLLVALAGVPSASTLSCTALLALAAVSTVLRANTRERNSGSQKRACSTELR
jgi:hypothetical protein